jgi:ABC-type branched-subunit amino acid transport system substrate-binding protein
MTLRRSLVSGFCSIGLVSALVLAGGAAGASAPRAATNGTATVGVILDSTLAQVVAQGKAGVNAAVKALNKKGGANGAKIVAKFCDSGSDANTAAKCASGFADDAKVSALVGTQTNFGDTVDPVIEKANLPSIGQSMFGLSDFKSPMIFPADGGSLSGIAAAGPICLNDLKGKSMALGYIDSASGAQLIPVFDTYVLKPFGTKLQTSVPIPTTAVDLSAQAAQLVSGNPDCIVAGVGADSAAALAKALKQQGFKGKLFVSGQAASPVTFSKQAGAVGNGTVLVDGYDYTSPTYKQFLADMKAAGYTDPSLISDGAARGWLATKIFADEATKAKATDRAAVLATLAAETGYDTKGMLKEPLDFTARKPNPAIFSGLAPNVIAPWAIGATVKNGKSTPITGQWQDAFGGPA